MYPDDAHTVELHFPFAGDELMDAELWYACAGPQKNLPPVNSIVAYLPQGHIEQVASFNNQNVDGQIPRYNLPAVIPCTLSDIKLSADPETDEVFATLTLFPLSDPVDEYAHPIERLLAPKQNFNSFTKILTVSDTSTHGGFSIPKRAAEDCLPLLDMSCEPPSQELVAKDLHGKEWSFKHIFRGQPKRHLLTTGWSTFVSQKRLVAGDVVIFLRGENGQMRVGVRRAPKEQMQQHLQSKVLTSPTMTIGVLAAAAHAASEKNRFSLIYNPRSCPSEFVVPYSKYLDAVKSKFTTGQRFKTRSESKEPTDRKYTGTIIGISDCDPARWPGSRWRSLQVEWDESASNDRQERISPWEVEPFIACPTPPPQVGARKRTKFLPSQLLKSDDYAGTSRVPLERAHECQTLQLGSVPRGVWDSRGVSGIRGTEVNAGSSAKLSWISNSEQLVQGYKGDDHVGNASGAELRSLFRKPDPMPPMDIPRNVPCVGLQDLLGAMGMESRHKNQHKLRVPEYQERNEMGHNLGSTTLQLSTLQQSPFISLSKAQPLSNVDLQLSAPSTPGNHPGCRSSNLLWPSFSASQQQPLRVSPSRESPLAEWLSYGIPQKRTGLGLRTPPSTTDCNVIPLSANMSSPQAFVTGSSSRPPTRVPNFWEGMLHSKAEEVVPAAPSQGENCKIFGVPLHGSAPDASSTQSSAVKAGNNNVDDAGTQSNSLCVDDPVNVEIATSTTGGAELQCVGQKCKAPQNTPQASLRSYTKVQKEGAIGRSVDVTKFPGYGELIQEIEELFHMEGELNNKKSDWQLVYTDHEDDVLMVGDDPWVDFCKCVRTIRILPQFEAFSKKQKRKRMLLEVTGFI